MVTVRLEWRIVVVRGMEPPPPESQSATARTLRRLWSRVWTAVVESRRQPRSEDDGSRTSSYWSQLFSSTSETGSVTLLTRFRTRLLSEDMGNGEC
ncbi:hypothetical protein C0J52_18393 [Blattella germanica]|nr:hypothetical protein C0J52_18393 [Blattella germanica]